LLTDAARREAYDRSMQRDRQRVGGWVRPESFRPVEAATGFRDLSLFEAFDTIGPSLEELLDRWFANFGSGGRSKSESMQPLVVDVPLTADQAALGGEVELSMPGRAACRGCAGHGEVGGYLCWRCGGTGFVTGDVPVRLAYPAGVRGQYVVRVGLGALGIRNLYLTVRFRVAGGAG
jgi:DnaJ-class molecular chaperone